MQEWNKKNRTTMKVWYSMDKYREDEKYGDNVQSVEGNMAYLNTPMASSYLNLETKEGIISISRELILKIEWLNTPAWCILNEKEVVDAAKMRLKHLKNDLEIQKNNFEQEQKLAELKEKEEKENGYE
jgi:hypothetical protein